MPRPSNTDERRSQIVEGLLEVMSGSGYERASVAAIARAAGLSPGLVHYHFESKQAILIELVERLVDSMNERYRARLAKAGEDARSRLDAFIEAHVARGKGMDARAVSAWVTIGAEAIRLPDVRVVYRRALAARLAELRELFAAVLRGQKRDARPARSMAAAVLSAIEGAYQIGTAAQELVPAGFAAPTLHRMVDGLLAQK